MWRVGTFCFTRWQKGAAELSAYENFAPDAPGKEQAACVSHESKFTQLQQQADFSLG
jgi:hypothetical protein